MRGEPLGESLLCPVVLDKRERDGHLQIAQPSPRMSGRHAHAVCSTPQRSQPVDCLEQVSLAVAEQRTRADRQPELRLYTETARTRGMTSHGCSLSFIQAAASRNGRGQVYIIVVIQDLIRRIAAVDHQ